MLCESCSEPIEMQSVVRLHNRALRRVVRALRASRKRQAEGIDRLFQELCDPSAREAAEKAFGELWGSGRFDCGPQDYEFMVERCLVAVSEYDERHTNPESSAEQVQSCADPSAVEGGLPEAESEDSAI